MLRNAEEYVATLAEIERLTRGPLVAHASGEELTPAQIADLRAAALLTEGLIGFDPRNYPPHLLKGEIRAALGEDESAEQAYSQAVVILPEPTRPEDKIAIGRAFSELSRIAFGRNDLTSARNSAERAVQLAPGSPDALVNLASVLVQDKEVVRARELLDRALKVDPQNARARQLLRLITMTG